MAKHEKNWITDAVLKSVNSGLRKAAKEQAEDPEFIMSAKQYGYIRFLLDLVEADQDEIDTVKEKWLSKMHKVFTSEFLKISKEKYRELKSTSISDLEINAHKYVYLRDKIKDLKGTQFDEEKEKLKDTYISKLSEKDKRRFMNIAQPVYKILQSVPISEKLEKYENNE